MKKYLFLAVMATTMVACGNGELEEVYNQYEEISEAKDEKKVDPNFLIHNDHYQKGKGETK
jgi:predicted solute-binding protein